MLSASRSSSSRVFTIRSSSGRIVSCKNGSISLQSLQRYMSSQANTPQTGSSTPPTSMDPQAMASEFIQKSSNARIPGTEAIQSYLTPEQKRSNYFLAAGLMGFVAWVFSYSLYAVGGNKSDKSLQPDNASMDLEQILRAEAREAQGRKIQEERKEKEVQDLVALDEELARVEKSTQSSLGIVQKIQTMEGGSKSKNTLLDDEVSDSTTTPKPRRWRLFFWRKD